VTVNHFDVAVVGGGLVGAACAYELAADGTTVVVVDEHDPGRATDAGAGILSPESLGAMPPAFLALADSAADHYRALVPALRDVGAPDPGYDVCGALCIAFRDVDDPFYADNRDAAFARHGDILRDVTSDRAREMFPPLAEVRAAYFNPRGARVDGRAITAALEHASRTRTVEHRHGRAHGVVVERGRAVGVDTDAGRLACGAVVVAGGAWTPQLASAFGLRVGVRPVRGQIVHLRLRADTAHWPVLTPVLSHYVVPWPEGRLALGATMDDVGFDARPTIGGMRHLLAEGLRLAPGLADATFVEVRAGLRPMSDDDLPVLGPLPGVSGAFVATGHGANGLLLGPVSGRLIAAVVHGETPPLDLEPFSRTRLS
jgi:D-amino-acid dehydrogenase